MARTWRIFSPGEGNGRIVSRTDMFGNTSKLIKGYDESDGILVPDPRAPLPSAGHWRTQATPRVTRDGRVYVPRTAKVKQARALKSVEYVGMSRRTDGDYVRDDLRRGERRERSVRERVRAAVACGAISAADAPRWAL